MELLCILVLSCCTFLYSKRKINSEKCFSTVLLIYYQVFLVSENFPWWLPKSFIGTHSLHVIRSSLFHSWNLIATIIPCWKHHAFRAFCIWSSDWVTEATGSNLWRTMCEKCIVFLPLCWNAYCDCKSSTDYSLRDICSRSCWSAWPGACIVKPHESPAMMQIWGLQTSPRWCAATQKAFALEIFLWDTVSSCLKSLSGDSERLWVPFHSLLSEQWYGVASLSHINMRWHHVIWGT